MLKEMKQVARDEKMLLKYSYWNTTRHRNASTRNHYASFAFHDSTSDGREMLMIMAAIIAVAIRDRKEAARGVPKVFGYGDIDDHDFDQ